MRKPTFCKCENKDADQLRGNREAEQRLYFRYIDSTIPLQLLKAYRIKFQKFAAHAHKDALINETFIPT